MTSPTSNGKTSLPVPDPSTLTTDQLHREILGLRELLEARITSESNVTKEKFASVTEQLELVERQRVEQKADTKAAVDAALTAQKEAVKEQTIASDKAITKSESGTAKQLEQTNENFITAITGATAIINDLKERVVALESSKAGSREAVSGITILIGIVISSLATIAAVVGLALTFHK